MAYFTTFTGKTIDFDTPDPAMISIEDIAHSLARICRFNGNTSEHYSVAQHSVLVARLVPRGLALDALLHDCHECYVGDMCSPLKRALSASALEELRQVEGRIVAAIEEGLGVQIRHSLIVKHFDRMLLRAESQRFLGGPVEEIWELPTPSFVDIEPWPAARAELVFLGMFNRLKRGAAQKTVAACNRFEWQEVAA